MERALGKETVDRYKALLERASKVEMTYDLLQEREEDLKGQVHSLQREDVLLGKVEELFKFLLEKYVYEYAESFSHIVTEGLQTIYHDQDVSFDIEVEQKRGKVYANFVIEENDVRGHPLESFGGGVSSVVSLILRVLVLLKADLSRYLILDESLASLSENYIETCGQFLRKLCEELGVKILLVTHNRDFIDQCDNSYLGTSNSNDRLALKKIR